MTSTELKSAAAEPELSPTYGLPPPRHQILAKRVLACVLCQQRKVKCDRRFPCGNCVKARVQCLAATPAPPRRRKKRSPLGGADEELQSRVRKYETLLKSYGHGGDIESPVEERQGDLGLSPNAPSSSNETPENDFEYDSESEFFPDIGGLMLDSVPADATLTSMHPQPTQIFRLWQTFLENVNPIIKLSHAPTMQSQILAASADLKNVSRPMEALMFAMYSAAVNSLSVEECQAMLGEKKIMVLRRFHLATLKGLQKARFLQSQDMVVLTAFVLFLIGARSYYDLRTLWVMAGIAVRIAQGMGLHTEPEDNSSISYFDREMRRRLWWQIVLVDSRLAAAADGPGAVSILDGKFTTKVPLNINDSDISAEMQEPPRDHVVGATEMIFALARYELNLFLRSNISGGPLPTNPSPPGWQLGDLTTPVSTKDAVIDGLANVLETKFVQYCDPSVPIHIMTIGLARTAVCKMRLVAHQPRNYINGVAGMSREERNMLFQNSVMSLEFDNIANTSPALAKYLWHINNHLNLDALVYMLSELRVRTAGEEVERAWKLVYDIYEHHPELASNKNPLWAAVGNLTLKAWEERQFMLGTFTTNPNTPIPLFIQKLFRQRAPDKLGKDRALSTGNGTLNPNNAPADFLRTEEYIKDLDHTAKSPSNFSAYHSTASISPGKIDTSTSIDPSLYSFAAQADTDWNWDDMTVDPPADTIPFDVAIGSDPMQLFAQLPAEEQPVDWGFWNGIMFPPATFGTYEDGSRATDV